MRRILNILSNTVAKPAETFFSAIANLHQLQRDLGRYPGHFSPWRMWLCSSASGQWHFNYGQSFLRYARVIMSLSLSMALGLCILMYAFDVCMWIRVSFFRVLQSIWLLEYAQWNYFSIALCAFLKCYLIATGYGIELDRKLGLCVYTVISWMQGAMSGTVELHLPN